MTALVLRCRPTIEPIHMTCAAARPNRPLEPARLVFDEGGHPFSDVFRDVYKNRHGAWAEARHVFVRGCDLPARWEGRSNSTLLELGFGLGVNFLATRDAWRAQRDRSGPQARLHYLAIEAHPVSAADLARGLRALGLPAAADEPLVRRWPAPQRGRHRIEFDDGLVLILIFDDVATALRGLTDGVDAIYLDGFSPARNPAMWHPAVMKALARLARPRCRLATYSVAGDVRRHLAGAGFESRLAAGVAGKRQCLHATYRPPVGVRVRQAAPGGPPERRAIIVGDGLAGTMIAHRLAGHGWTLHNIGRPAPDPGAGSAQPVLAAHPHFSPDDNLLSRLTRSAMALAESEAPELLTLFGRQPMRLHWWPRLVLAISQDDARRLSALPARAGLSRDSLTVVDAARASELAGVPVRHGGLLLARCAVYRMANGASDEPPVADDPDTAQSHGYTRADITRIERRDGQWQVFDRENQSVASAPHLVLATGNPAHSLVGDLRLQARALRGQSSWVSHPSLRSLKAVIGAQSYACPGDAGVLAGASFDLRADTAPDPADDAANLQRLQSMLAIELAGAQVRVAAVGHRHASTDRLAWIGAVPDVREVSATADALRRNDRLALPRLPGLWMAAGFGSRGLLWALLAARVLADRLESVPTILDARQLDALDPGRALRQALRHHRSVRCIGATGGHDG
ncbi:MAG: FAD-dependent 5-carboxymethylaminomethyl-2-thiouridine(34) oxidoreductase MnmC [Burkholderiaceae bacterium]